MLNPHPRPSILVSLTAFAILAPPSVPSLSFRRPAPGRGWATSRGRGVPADGGMRQDGEPRPGHCSAAALRASTRGAHRPSGLEATAARCDAGFQDSYKAEIAAYELDKLLTLDMVPPAVERVLQGIKGSRPNGSRTSCRSSGTGPGAPPRSAGTRKSRR